MIQNFVQEYFGCKWNISALCNNVMCLVLDLSCILALFNDKNSFSKKTVHGAYYYYKCLIHISMH